MNNDNKETITKGKKSASVALVICFVAVVAAVGTYTFKNYKGSVQDEMAKSQEQLQDELAKADMDAEETNTTNILHETDDSDDAEDDDDSKETETGEGDGTAAKDDAGGDKTSAGESEAPAKLPEAQNTSGTAEQVFFADGTDLLWPVDGSVIMNYSMDKTVYFATLDQYKYNPAMIISGNPGSKVTAAARGIVKSIEEKAATGLTMTLDIGNGYELVYGQLKDVQFAKGNVVEAGALLGYLQQPSRYYSVEGCNLYFQVLKDGKPVNPLDYLEA